MRENPWAAYSSPKAVGWESGALRFPKKATSALDPWSSRFGPLNLALYLIQTLPYTHIVYGLLIISLVNVDRFSKYVFFLDSKVNRLCRLYRRPPHLNCAAMLSSEIRIF